MFSPLSSETPRYFSREVMMLHLWFLFWLPPSHKFPFLSMCSTCALLILYSSLSCSHVCLSNHHGTRPYLPNFYIPGTYHSVWHIVNHKLCIHIVVGSTVTSKRQVHDLILPHLPEPVKVTLFGERVFVSVSKRLLMRLSWITWVDLKFSGHCPYRRQKREDIDTEEKTV
jgi:hypothetical protein